MLRWTKSKSIRPQAKERLYPSFVNVKHKDHVFISKKRRMEVGSKTPWASKHHAGRGQYASGIGSSKVQWSLVKRSLIGVTKHDTRNIARLIQRKVMRNFGTKARRSL